MALANKTVLVRNKSIMFLSLYLTLLLKKKCLLPLKKSFWILLLLWNSQPELKCNTIKLWSLCHVVCQRAGQSTTWRDLKAADVASFTKVFLSIPCCKYTNTKSSSLSSRVISASQKYNSEWTLSPSAIGQQTYSPVSCIHETNMMDVSTETSKVRFLTRVIWTHTHTHTPFSFSAESAEMVSWGVAEF